MSKNYLAFYRKYRPKTLADVVGQDFIVQTLKNIISTDKIFHAYLFSGPRGTGKTSIAKIFASTINCSHKSDSFIPCQECQDNVNNSFDIVEMDGASNNGVDEIRELINNVNNLPVNSKYKIYIIDEVHMLSSSAFNAFLKTLEEPPKHIIFILATTEPQKIPLTILSRVQRFNFRKISEKEIVSRLEFVLQKEEISYENEALWAIAQLSYGSLRDALSMVEQLSNFSRSQIHMVDVENLFGLTSTQKLIEIIKKIDSQDVKQTFHLISSVLEEGANPVILISSLISLVKNFIIYKKTKDSSLLEGFSLDQIEKIPFSVLSAYKFQDILVATQKELHNSNNPTMTIQLAILKFFSATDKSIAEQTVFNNGPDPRDIHLKHLYETTDLKPSREASLASMEELALVTELSLDKKKKPSWLNEIKNTSRVKPENSNPFATNSWKDDFKPNIPSKMKQNEETKPQNDDTLTLLNQDTLIAEIKNELEAQQQDKKITINNPQGLALFEENVPEEAEDTNQENFQFQQNLLQNEEHFYQETNNLYNNIPQTPKTEEVVDYLNEEQVYNLFRLYTQNIEQNKNINIKIKKEWNDKVKLASTNSEYALFYELLKKSKLIVSSTEFILVTLAEEDPELENYFIQVLQNHPTLASKTLEYIFKTPMHLFFISSKLSKITIKNWKENSSFLKNIPAVPLTKLSAESLSDESRLFEIFPNRKTQSKKRKLS